MNARIYWVRNDENKIVGVQIDFNGNEYEMARFYGSHLCEYTTNSRKEGLWDGDHQILGTCDFDLCCSESTAKKRLKEVICSQLTDGCDISFTVVRKPIVR